ncbi:DUF1345 domain-containing protein [Rhizobiaceae bacterium BDR2-2]|uniref:DUF1345 domain-containing protein n=1 Tax=Ectorhizobium quercum TaxID=2965071 RepID=A0AAE3MYN9_9HYPH|nr:DUF1345 domain-containing protein [Ectorhizobium quercum]MCX8996896.1 DUF1345 domain-containing protein [Ectorhizobium quercum]
MAMALLTSVIAGIALLSAGWSATNALIVWNLSALVYLAVAWYRMITVDLDGLRRRAADLDFSDSVILVLSVVAALASIAGIGFELLGAQESPPHEKLLGAALAMTTVLLSWAFLHTLFTLHYAHRFYSGDGAGAGLIFPEEHAVPEYWDFAYFSFTIGVAAQTADVMVSSLPMRRLVFFHAILSFLFNTTILALAVNAGVSLI